MDFCPVAGVGELCGFYSFPGDLNINLFHGLNLAQKAINVRALAACKHREMGLQGPMLEEKYTKIDSQAHVSTQGSKSQRELS